MNDINNNFLFINYFVRNCYKVCDLKPFSVYLDGGSSDNRFPWKVPPTVNPVLKDKRGSYELSLTGKYVYVLYLLCINI